MSIIKFSNIASTYSEYLETLYSYALHLGFDEQTAMDAIHDVFYKLCMSYSSVDEIANLKVFLFKSVRNRLLDIWRMNKKYLGELSDEDGIDDNMCFLSGVTIEDELIDKEDLEEIKQKVEIVLSRLTDRQREIIYLRYIQEYEYEEIAELMHISVESCRNLISKTLKKLKNNSIPVVFFLLSIYNKY
jgi:RNA polymerase sigma factor (sigma-70 family)